MQELADAAGVSSDEITADFKLMGSQSEESLQPADYDHRGQRPRCRGGDGYGSQARHQRRSAWHGTRCAGNGRPRASAERAEFSNCAVDGGLVIPIASEGAKIAGLSFEDIVTTFTALVSVLQSAGTGLASWAAQRDFPGRLVN